MSKKKNKNFSVPSAVITLPEGIEINPLAANVDSVEEIVESHNAEMDELDHGEVGHAVEEGPAISEDMETEGLGDQESQETSEDSEGTQEEVKPSGIFKGYDIEGNPVYAR